MLSMILLTSCPPRKESHIEKKKVKNVLFISVQGIFPKVSVFKREIFIISQFLCSGFLAQLDWVRWLRASQKAAVKVLAEATVVSKFYQGGIGFQAYARGRWQDLVPCLLLHWGPQFFNGCCLEATLSSWPHGLLYRTTWNMVVVFP